MLLPDTLSDETLDLLNRTPEDLEEHFRHVPFVADRFVTIKRYDQPLSQLAVISDAVRYSLLDPEVGWQTIRVLVTVIAGIIDTEATA